MQFNPLYDLLDRQIGCDFELSGEKLPVSYAVRGFGEARRCFSVFTDEFDSFWRSNLHERRVFGLIGELLRKGGVFIDAGSWIGDMTLYGAHFADRTISIEPNRAAASYLSLNLDLNEDVIRPVAIESAALSGSTGIGELSVPVNSLRSVASLSEYNPAFRKFEQRRGQPQDVIIEQVALISLPDLLQKHKISSVQLLKMDIEGAERQVLAHQSACINTIEAVLIELHPYRFKQNDGYFTDIRSGLRSFPHVFWFRSEDGEINFDQLEGQRVDQFVLATRSSSTDLARRWISSEGNNYSSL